MIELQDTGKDNVKWTRSGRGFTVDVQTDQDVVRLEMHGEVDLYTQPVLRSVVDEAIGMGKQKLVFDFADVSHLDSGGMAILIAAAKRLMQRNGTLELVSVNRHIYRTLTVTGLADFLNAKPVEG